MNISRAHVMHHVRNAGEGLWSLIDEPGLPSALVPAIVAVMDELHSAIHILQEGIAVESMNALTEELAAQEGPHQPELPFEA